ncbi:hypothetical protein ENUP19_0082G0147 [Entamoeba nuttalli]|uniref:Protein kinase, putative n=2 Tax=Entamoeba nuttalli TaxID=412467 RepID=K2HXX9_ENTNP|nr:protein kinase, putative [Entamoeba nuttalli P19]EKE41150.1 protein kinase, putative [Entamoeba nuttalli P19]|eukprot:XP_008856519.1 protein kinase, putative [Entamoeba nuttalli P19]
MFSFFRRPNNSFPLNVSKYVITCNQKNIELPLFEEFHDEIYVSNPTDFEYAFILDWPNHQYTLIAEPTRAILGPHTGVSIGITLKFLCSTKNYLPIKLYCSEGESVDKQAPQFTTQIKFGIIAQESVVFDVETITKFDTIKTANSGEVSTALFNGKDVIMKHFNIDWSSEAREMFAKAAKELADIQCPQLIKVIGATVAPGREAFIIEYAKFGNIATCYRREDLPIKWIKKAFNDVMTAIKYLHDNNKVHGDIKPQNLLVFSLNKKDDVVCKLSDYWNIQQITGVSSDIITDDEMISVAIFQAPEVLKGKEPTKSSDIYSLGMCLLEIFQQHEIYQDKPFVNGWDAAVQVAKGKRPNFDTDFNEQIASIIKQCWQQDKDERPSIDEVINQFQSIKF